MKKFKIVYWKHGDKCVSETEAPTMQEAKLLFMLSVSHDDIISIEEVKE